MITLYTKGADEILLPRISHF
jgi:magnesium-transporting ATPase (P-type)